MHLLLAASGVAPALAAALVQAIWQGALLVLVAACILRLLPGLASGARSLVWTGVFLLLLLLHLQPAHAAARGALHGDARWSFALVAVWLAFSAGRAAQFLVAAESLRRIARRALRIDAPAPLAEVLARYKTQLCISCDVDRPSVVGFWKRRILLPPELAERLTSAEMRAVVLHELEHLRRRDDWTNLLQKLALVVVPLNPALIWVERRLCLERELACDDEVLLQTGARKAYATTLANLAEHALLRRGVSLALRLVGGRPSELTRRVTRILARPARSMSPRAAAFVVLALLGTVSFAAVRLSRSPGLVSFAPLASVAELDSGAVPALDLPGRAILTRALMPVESGRVEEPRPQKRDLGHPRLVRTRKARRLPPRVFQGELRVLRADWEEVPVRRVRQVDQVRQVWVQQVSFAAIATPDGWLVIPL